MQLRMSPGGSMLNSLRRRPLEPPSSLTVTTAQRSRMTGASGEVDNSVSGVPTNFFSPLSRVERPVPPPIATTRRPRSRADLSDGGHSTVLLCIEETPQGWLRRLVLEVAFRRINFLAGIRIQQLGEAWILDQILEVGIVPRLETQLRIEVEGFIQTAEGILDVAGQAIERSHTVNHIICLGILLEQLFKMLARAHIIAD